jgi:DNA invertase Pin-like site-specific DNA recombinase
MPKYFNRRKPTATPTAWVYCGVSSKIQAKKDKVSLSVQEREGRELAAHKGWVVTKVITVDGHSRSDTNFDDVNAEMLAAKPPITAYDELSKAMREQSYAPDHIIFYSGDRLGRSQSILTYIIETLVRRGTHFYSLHDGKDIDPDNFRDYISRQGERAARGVDELVIRRRNTMLEYVHKGLPTSSHLPFTHERVRDPKTGQTIGMRVNEDARRVMYDAAELLLEGVGWPTLGRQLKEKYGHTSANGHPLTKLKIRFGFLSPQCWGHNAMNYHGHELGYGIGLWVLGPDEAESPPKGATVAYNVVEPVFTGELAERVKAELRRRRKVVGGRSKSDTTYFLRGLYICGECGRMMAIQRRYVGLTEVAWASTYCARKAETKVWGAGKDCTQSKWINDQKVRAFMRELIDEVIASGVPKRPAPPRVDSDSSGIDQSIAELNARLQRLVVLQSMAENSEAMMAYMNEVNAVSAQLATAKRKLAAAARVPTGPDTPSLSEAALARLRKNGAAWLWAQPDYKVNQFLHELLGGARITAHNGVLRFLPE